MISPLLMPICPYFDLGRVDKVSDPQPEGADEREAEIAGRGLVVTGRDPTVVLEAVEAPFDPVAQSIDEAVDGDLHETVALHGDDWLCPARPQIVADGIAVVALVADQHLRLRPRLIHHRAEGLGVGSLAGCQDEGDGEPETVRAEVDLGREATTRTADIVVRRA